MIVVLTGGTGYVGRHVAARCADLGWQVHVLTRSASRIPEMLAGRVTRHDCEGSVKELATILAEVEPDCVVHLASASTGIHTAELVEQLVEGNIRFPVRLLEAMREVGVNAIVNTGTFWQHYAQERYRPVDFYAATKQAFEDLLRHYTDMHGFRAITLKLYDNYGPRDPRRKIVTGLVEAARSGQTLEMSAGEQLLDLTHVDDLADAFTTAIDLVCGAAAGDNRCFFVSGERITLKALVEMVAACSPRPLDARMGARPYRIREIMDPISAEDRRLPGWQARRGLAATIDALFLDG